MSMFIEIIIPVGWTAFVDGNKCVGYQEFKQGGKAKTKLTIISKETKAELLAELKRLNITLPS